MLRQFKFINFIIIIPFLFQSISSQNIKLNNGQLKTILLSYFSEINMPTLLGHRFFKLKKETAVQLDIEIIDGNLNDTIYLSFETLNKLSKVSNEPFSQLFIIIHFKNLSQRSWNLMTLNLPISNHKPKFFLYAQ